MTRTSLVLGLIIACSACTQPGSEDNRSAGAAASKEAHGPAPEARIVDLPMDSISNEDAEWEDHEEGSEQQIMETER